VCYENFAGNHQVAHMHLQNGLHIIAKECRKQRSSNVPKDIIQVFKRLDIQAITIGDGKVTYPDHLSKEHIELLTTPPIAFGSIEDSIDLVLHLCRWLFHRAAYSESYSESCPIPPEDVIAANKALERWNMEIKAYFSSPNTTTKGQLPRPIALLKIYQIIMTIIISTGVHGQETLHDTYLEKYEEVVLLCRELLQDGKGSVSDSSSNRFFCFDIGVIFPLFWVAIKCRETYTRRRAVKLLGSLHHQEGSWKSTTAAKVAEFVIRIEEEGLPKGGGQIPELARVHLVNTTADVERGEIRVSCVLRSEHDHSSWYTRDGRIPDTVELSLS
jgi:hypothetical protein